MDRYFYLNGSIVAEKDAKLPITDLSVTRGYGIFDYFRIVKKKPFLLDDYLDRFIKSSEYTGIKIPISRSEIKEVINELIKKNNLENSGVRMILTGGASTNAFDPSEPNFLMIYENSFPPSGPDYDNGIKLMTHHYQREWSRIKSINYFTVVHLLPTIRSKSASDVLYYYNGKVLECSRSNFFIIRNDKIITPVENILLGVTRKKVIELSRLNFEVEERDVSLEEALAADEAFVTGTGRKILPVVKIDDTVIGSGKPGKVTQRVSSIFDVFEEEYLSK